jgi:hypothetical protein
MNRTTINARQNLHWLAPVGTNLLKVLINGTPHTEISNASVNGKTNTAVFAFNTVKQGDVLDFQICNANDVVQQSKKYIVFPENRRSQMIEWVNEYLVTSSFELTGEIKTTSDFEYSLQRFFKNNNENIVTNDTRKDVKLFINTGWISQNDVDTIESILRSKKVFMQNNVGQIIYLIPQSKSITNVDTQRELIDYNLEFLINKNHDAETYSF